MKSSNRPEPDPTPRPQKSTPTTSPPDPFTRLLARYRRQVYECYQPGCQLNSSDTVAELVSIQSSL